MGLGMPFFWINSRVGGRSVVAPFKARDALSGTCLRLSHDSCVIPRNCEKSTCSSTGITFFWFDAEAAERFSLQGSGIGEQREGLSGSAGEDGFVPCQGREIVKQGAQAVHGLSGCGDLAARLAPGCFGDIGLCHG